MLENGLTKAHAIKFATFLVEFLDSVDKSEVQIQAPRQRGKSITDFNKQEVQLAETLNIKVKKYIDSTGYKYKIPDVVDFSLGISLVHRLDGKSYEEIQSLIAYLYDYYQPNGRFDWRMQVRSGASFRKHYEKIMISANQDYSFKKSRQIEDVK